MEFHAEVLRGGVWHPRIPDWPDFAATLLVLGVVILMGVGAHQMVGPFVPEHQPEISLSPAALPLYTLRTVMRMLVALVASLIFTFTYATIAAKSRRAEMVLIPLLDMLQSVPILGYLSFTVVFFVSLFPGNMLGPELAAIFAIFTSQAWNMAFSFYQSLRTIPTDLDEASRSFRASGWQRFWRLDVPFAMPGLVWNMMMSMSGGWFFVVAAEAISVGDVQIALPGVGSYVAKAIEHRDLAAVGWAIAADPILLLMDEPFSALDVLTAETLRTDFLDLWTAHKLPTKAVLMVIHNIEEAVAMCDRILVLGSDPGHIAAEIPVSLPQPRNPLDAAFHAILDEIYAILTSRMTAAIRAQSQVRGGLAQLLPPVPVDRIGGFLETLTSPPYEGRADLAKIAGPLGLEINHLFPIAATLHILEFVELKDSTITLTAAGRIFAQSATEERKRLFREHVVRFVPLAAQIRQVVNEREDHQAPRARYELELQDHLNRNDAASTLQAIINWGRYAELFTYEDRTQTFGPAQS